MGAAIPIAVGALFAATDSEAAVVTGGIELGPSEDSAVPSVDIPGKKIVRSLGRVVMVTVRLFDRYWEPLGAMPIGVKLLSPATINVSGVVVNAADFLWVLGI